MTKDRKWQYHPLSEMVFRSRSSGGKVREVILHQIQLLTKSQSETRRFDGFKNISKNGLPPCTKLKELFTRSLKPGDLMKHLR